MANKTTQSKTKSINNPKEEVKIIKQSSSFGTKFIFVIFLSIFVAIGSFVYKNDFENGKILLKSELVSKILASFIPPRIGSEVTETTKTKAVILFLTYLQKILFICSSI
jgi:hypothetical protein